MDNLGNLLYRHAAKLIALSVVFAFAFYLWGALGPSSQQTTLFKGAELFVWAAGLLSVLLVRKQLHAQERQLEAHRIQQDDAFAQLQADHEWKCYAFYHQHFSDVPSEGIRVALYQLAGDPDHGFIGCFDGRGVPLPDSVVQHLIGSESERNLIRPYLDCFEIFCGAINAKLVHEDYAFTLQATRIIRNFAVFSPLIDHYKVTVPTAYCEFIRVASRWRIKLAIAEAGNVEGLGLNGDGARPVQGPQRRGVEEAA